MNGLEQDAPLLNQRMIPRVELSIFVAGQLHSWIDPARTVRCIEEGSGPGTVLGWLDQPDDFAKSRVNGMIQSL